MNSTQLECFLSVAENLNYARAAEENNLTQPAVTHQINSLEAELGVKLFTRTTRKVELTMEGINFISDAKSIIRSMHIAKGRLLAKQESSISLFTIGCHNTFELQLLPNILRSLKEQFPQIHPVLKIIPLRILENLLEEESIDLMLNFKQEKGIKKSWIYHELLKIGTTCALSKNHTCSSLPVITEKELFREKLILLEPRKLPSQLFIQQAKYVSAHTPAELYFCEDFESALTLVKADLGMTLLPDIKWMEIPELLYLPLEVSPSFSYGIYYKASKRSPILKEFIRLAEEMLKPAKGIPTESFSRS